MVMKIDALLGKFVGTIFPSVIRGFDRILVFTILYGVHRCTDLGLGGMGVATVTKFATARIIGVVKAARSI